MQQTRSSYKISIHAWARRTWWKFLDKYFRIYESTRSYYKINIHEHSIYELSISEETAVLNDLFNQGNLLSFGAHKTGDPRGLVWYNYKHICACARPVGVRAVWTGQKLRARNLENHYYSLSWPIVALPYCVWFSSEIYRYFARSVALLAGSSRSRTPPADPRAPVTGYAVVCMLARSFRGS
jgi:hypothetical protein